MLWDIFCKVIDNHGDIGVTWRLASQLAGRGHAVRLHVDDASALQWMAPHGARGVEVLAWPQAGRTFEPADAVVEAFGCELDADTQRAIAHCKPQPAWINLEYLTAEAFGQRNHRLASPVLSGPAAGCTKHFFYPGFTPATGGLLRETGLAVAQESFDRVSWLAAQGVDATLPAVSLFCYEPELLVPWLRLLASAHSKTTLLVTAGRAGKAVARAVGDLTKEAPSWNAGERVVLHRLPLLTQHEYDHLLWACDFNFVRGEDSLVRALWAGQPFVWQIYPQHDNAHHAKLEAFLAWLQAPASMRAFMRAWNGIVPASEATLRPSRPDLLQWRECVQAARSRLLQRDDLASQLIAFCESLRP